VVRAAWLVFRTLPAKSQHNNERQYGFFLESVALGDWAEIEPQASAPGRGGFPGLGRKAEALGLFSSVPGQADETAEGTT